MKKTFEEPPLDLKENSDGLSRAVVVSILFHGLVLFVFTVKSIFFPSEAIDFQAAVRVDIVGLPDKIQPDQLPPKPEEPVAKPTPPAPPPPKPEEIAKPTPAPPAPTAKKEPDTISLEKQKSKEKAAMDKLKAMAALDKIKEDVDSEHKKKAAAQKPAAVKGNILSPGTALTGLSKLQHDNYIANLDQHIKQNWALPEWLSKKDYKAQVRLRIDDRGNILSRQIAKSSGNPSYDDEVLATIDKSAPFPAPPEKFVAIVKIDGILIGFPE